MDTGKGVTVVIDADYRNDNFGDIHDGNKNFAKLQAAIGESLPPNTPTVRTGGGGRNYWFRLPDGVTLPSIDAIFKNTKHGSFPNIDLKCVSGKVMLPGSKHKSGQQYEWISDTTIDGELPEMPPKLLALIQETIEAKKQAKAGSNYKYDAAAIYGDGERNAALTSYLGWRRLSVLALDELMMFANVFNQTQCQPPLPEAEVLSIAKSMMKYKAVLGKCFPLDDTGNAYLFADLHGGAVRFDHHREKWFLWDEHRWTLDQGNRIRRLAEDVAIARRENLSAGPSKKEITFAQRCGDSDKKDKLLMEAQAMVPISMTEEWDIDPWLLGVSNGVVELKTGILRAGKALDRITKQASVPFDPKGTCPRWHQFLDEIFGGDMEMVNFMQRAIGYTLTGSLREQVCFMCYGTGANGKSVLFTTLRNIFGDYAKKAASGLFSAKGTSSISNDVADVQGARLVLLCLNEKVA